MPKQNIRILIVLLADLVIFCTVALFFWFFTQDMLVHGNAIINLGALYICMLIFQILFHTYNSLWRYAAHQEYFSLLAGAASGAVLYDIIHYATGMLKLNTTFVWGIASLTTLCMLGMRFVYRLLRERHKGQRLGSDTRKPVAIVGAGTAGMLLMSEFQSNETNSFRPTCFFDDDSEKFKRRMGGISVLGTIDDIPTILKTTNVKAIFVAIPSASSERMSEILQICHRVPGADIRVIPNTFLSLPQKQQKSLSKTLRKVEISDLLGRPQINLGGNAVQNLIANQVVLVTGGGGSIGSELCRQIAAANPKQLVLMDIYENNAYDIQQELLRVYGTSLNLKVEIASVRDEERMNELFTLYYPDIVFHAAAHKHVPLMENNPLEAVRNNVFGTYHVAMAAHRSGTKKFVQISTDKAVNPTNVMGATKRMCEIILQGIQEISSTEFVAVRFGNVLGSNGSVIPLFQRQIANGGPVTLTDKRITRYFMTIPEAVQLVLQAGAIATKNQVFVLDMGHPIRILDLAENLIRLSGYEPYKDIDIKEVGLRPGEKLYEELLVGGKVVQTENDLIFVEEQPELTAQEVEKKLSLLREAVATRDDAIVRQALKQAVPTYHSPHEVNQQISKNPVIEIHEQPLQQQRTVTCP